MKGLDATIKALQDVGKMKGKDIQDALKLAGKPILQTIQSGATVRGINADAYRFVTANESKYASERGAAVLMAINFRAGRGFLIPFFEYGTLAWRTEPLSPKTRRRPQALETLSHGGGMPADPWIRAAIDNGIDAAGSFMVKYLKKQLAKSVLAMEKRRNKNYL